MKMICGGFTPTPPHTFFLDEKSMQKCIPIHDQDVAWPV